MSNFVQNVLKKPYEDVRTVWDLYNYGTSVMKPGMLDIANIQSSSALFAEYLIDNFKISAN
jgi:hypothetical protein